MPNYSFQCIDANTVAGMLRTGEWIVAGDDRRIDGYKCVYFEEDTGRVAVLEKVPRGAKKSFLYIPRKSFVKALALLAAEGDTARVEAQIAEQEAKAALRIQQEQLAAVGGMSVTEVAGTQELPVGNTDFLQELQRLTDTTTTNPDGSVSFNTQMPNTTFLGQGLGVQGAAGLIAIAVIAFLGGRKR